MARRKSTYSRPAQSADRLRLRWAAGQSAGGHLWRSTSWRFQCRHERRPGIARHVAHSGWMKRTVRYSDNLLSSGPAPGRELPAEATLEKMTPSIGVFDSGFGGLTVLRALVERLPGASIPFWAIRPGFPMAPNRGAPSPATPRRARSSWSTNRARSSW